MRLRSRGLGRKELVMDFREYRASRNGDEVVITGSVHEPVHWDFSFRVCQDDVPGLIKMIAGPAMLRFVLTSLFRRKKNHHWSNELKEHRAEVKEHIRELKEKVAKQDLDLGDKLGRGASAAGTRSTAGTGSSAAGETAAQQPQAQKVAALATVGGGSTNGNLSNDAADLDGETDA